MDRSAVDTIRGYCYQFDKTILDILSLEKDTDSIEVEGIEDIDIRNNGELTAVQCKYYEKTSYNHSVIAKAIRLMLENFAKNRSSVGKYHLYGHYKDGHEKLPDTISVDFLKEKFLTYKKDKILHEEHSKLNLTDDDLKDFLDKLSLNIRAKSFEEQQKQVIEKLVSIFTCRMEEAMHYYYNAAFSKISNLGCQQDCRRITKQEFISTIDKSKALLNIWLLKHKGRKAYLSKLKSDLLPRQLNTQPYDRFFILDATNAQNDSDIKDCIYTIQKNWSNLSKRTPLPFSPYIFLHGKEKIYLHSIKEQLFAEGLIFSDGYNFKGSNFCVNTIVQSKEARDIKFQYIETKEDLISTINHAKSRVEVYQFFCDENDFPTTFNTAAKITAFQIMNFEDIKDIV